MHPRLLDVQTSFLSLYLPFVSFAVYQGLIDNVTLECVGQSQTTRSKGSKKKQGVPKQVLWNVDESQRFRSNQSLAFTTFKAFFKIERRQILEETQNLVICNLCSSPSSSLITQHDTVTGGSHVAISSPSLTPKEHSVHCHPTNMLQNPASVNPPLALKEQCTPHPCAQQNFNSVHQMLQYMCNAIFGQNLFSNY